MFYCIVICAKIVKYSAMFYKDSHVCFKNVSTSELITCMHSRNIVLSLYFPFILHSMSLITQNKYFVHVIMLINVLCTYVYDVQK